MTYRDQLTAANTALAQDPKRIFVGYGLLHGRAAGTLKDVPARQILETPVAENLMVGLALGLALRGLKPVVYFERFDFVLNALDALVNHVDALPVISRAEFRTGLIFRITVGNTRNPLFTGYTHTRNHTEALKHLVTFPVWQLTPGNATTIAEDYAAAAEHQERGLSTALVEHKDLL